MNRTPTPRTLLLAVTLSAGVSAGFTAVAQAKPGARPLLRTQATPPAAAQPLQRADGRPANGNIGQRGRPSGPAPVAASSPAAIATGVGVTGPLLGRGDRPVCGNVVTKGGRTVTCRDGAGRVVSSTSYRGQRVTHRALYLDGVLTASERYQGDRVVATCATPPLPGRRWLVCRDEAGLVTSRTAVDADQAGVHEQYAGGRLRSVTRTGPTGVMAETVEYNDAGRVVRHIRFDARGGTAEIIEHDDAGRVVRHLRTDASGNLVDVSARTPSPAGSGRGS